MAIILPNLRQIVKYAGGVKDPATARAVRNLEDWADELTRRLALLDVTSGGGGITLPIAESDVTNLTTDLAGKVPTTRTLQGTSPILVDGDNAAHDLSANRTISLDSSLLLGGLFGSGIDGAVTWDGASTVLGFVPSGGKYTLNRNVYCAGSTVQAGVTIDLAGYGYWDSGTLRLDGTISSDGASGANGTGPFGGAGGAVVAGGYLPGRANGGGGSSPPGGANVAGNTSASAPRGMTAGGTTGTTGAGASGSTGQGGSGGGIPGGKAGANGGVVTLLGAANGAIDDLLLAVTGRSVAGSTYFTAGSGGGGGGCASGGGGGGGGAGGGYALVVAKTITGSGLVSANGGSGGNGYSGAGATNEAGGGGGSGGIVVVVIATGSFPSTSAAGGAGGVGHGTGNAGGNGGSGLIRTYRLGW